MLVAQSPSTDGKSITLLLGLTHANISRLQAGQPMLITRAKHGEAIPEGLNISILYGETEMAIYGVLQGLNALAPDCKTTIDSRLQDGPGIIPPGSGG